MNDEIRIIPITTKKGLKTFIQFHYDLYRDHKFAIPFLRFDEMNTLDPKKNPAFEFCEAQYFLAVDSEARIVGKLLPLSTIVPMNSGTKSRFASAGSISWIMLRFPVPCCVR